MKKESVCAIVPSHGEVPEWSPRTKVRIEFFAEEECQSGRMGHPAKVLGGQLPRGFESLLLRKEL